MFSTWALLLKKKVGEGTRGMSEEGYHEFWWHVSKYSTSHRLHNDVQPFPAIAIFLFYLDMQAWALLTGRDCIVSDTKVTVKARGSLVKTYEDNHLLQEFGQACPFGFCKRQEKEFILIKKPLYWVKCQMIK